MSTQLDEPVGPSVVIKKVGKVTLVEPPSTEEARVIVDPVRMFLILRDEHTSSARKVIIVGTHGIVITLRYAMVPEDLDTLTAYFLIKPVAKVQATEIHTLIFKEDVLRYAFQNNQAQVANNLSADDLEESAEDLARKGIAVNSTKIYEIVASLVEYVQTFTQCTLQVSTDASKQEITVKVTTPATWTNKGDTVWLLDPEKCLRDFAINLRKT